MKKVWYFEVFNSDTNQWDSVESPKSNKGQQRLMYDKRYMGKRVRFGFKTVSQQEADCFAIVNNKRLTIPKKSDTMYF